MFEKFDKRVLPHAAARIGGTIVGAITGKIVGGKINHPTEGTIVGGTIGYLATDTAIAKKEIERLANENAILSEQLAGIQPPVVEDFSYDDIDCDINDINVSDVNIDDDDII